MNAKDEETIVLGKFYRYLAERRMQRLLASLFIDFQSIDMSYANTSE